MSTVTKTQKGLGVRYAEEVLGETNKPMSIDQIIGKYQLTFPFQVKRVLPSPLLSGPNRCECMRPQLHPGFVFTVVGRETEDKSVFNCYRVAEDCACLHYMNLVLHPNIEAFVLV